MPRSLLLTLVLSATVAVAAPAQARFSVSYPATAGAGPITGRVLVFVSRDPSPEPRFLSHPFGRGTPFFGKDVSAWKPGAPAVIDAAALGYPVASVRDLPAGDYYVQALVTVYSQVHRADGHTIWVHWDQWEGQQVTTSPGNLYSAVQKVHLDPATESDVALSLTEVIPPVQVPPDTRWVKHVKIQSPLLTRFWGRPVYLGATVLLPKGYEQHPAARYPVVFEQDTSGSSRHSDSRRTRPPCHR